MVAAHEKLSRKFRNTNEIIKSGNSNLISNLHSKYPEDYVNLQTHNVISKTVPWQEFPSPLRSMSRYGFVGLQPTVVDKILVLCVDFEDQPAQISTDIIYERFFGDYSNSLKNYYKEVSYDIYDPRGDVWGWYRAPKPKSYYTNDNNGFGDYPRNVQKLIEDTILIAAQDPDIYWEDFDNNNNGYVDNLFVVHSGAEAAYTGDINDFWAHVYATYNPIQIDITGNPNGVISWIYATTSEYLNQPADPQTIGGDCHEHGHQLGLPDLYDITDQSNGVGAYSLMGAGSWGNNGITPTHLEAWSKYVLGFTETKEDISGPIYIDNTEISPNIFKYTTNDPKEYFLVENRQKLLYDKYLPSEGIFIWHINENKQDNSDKTCYLVGLVQADNYNDLENRANNGDDGDPYPGTTNNRSFGISTIPNSKLCDNTIKNMLISKISDSAKTMIFESAPI